MVSINYLIECSCGGQRKKYVESGQSDQWNAQFECSHFSCNIYQKTKLGFFFGANANIKLWFEPKCLKCRHQWSDYYLEYWGWNNKDSSYTSYKCCGHQLVIRSQESNHWITQVPPHEFIRNSIIPGPYLS